MKPSLNHFLPNQNLREITSWLPSYADEDNLDKKIDDLTKLPVAEVSKKYINEPAQN